VDNILRVQVLEGYQDLGNEELGHPLAQPTPRMREDHLQHVAFELLHHHKNPLRSLKHPLEIDDSAVRDVLQDGHFVLQLRLLFGGKAQLIDHLDGHLTLRLFVDSTIDHAKLS